MVNFFSYDNRKNQIVVEEPQIFLVKEFADLWTNERNKCKEDPTGEQKLRGFKELIYIYIAIDWKAPGSKDTPDNRHKMAMEASGLTEQELEDPIFKKACKKYKELQDNSSVLGKMIQTYRNKLHEIELFIESIDFNERTDTGMPIFKIGDTFKEMKALKEAYLSLKDLEQMQREEQDAAIGIRGGMKKGRYD